MPIPYFESTHVELLACECFDCTHWELVRMPDQSIHLHCKTCERTHSLDAFTIHEDPNNNVKWVARNKE
jgi:hypothetical protein